MKRITILLLTVLLIKTAFSQDIRGGLYNIKTNQLIELADSTEIPLLVLSGNRKSIYFRPDTNSYFTIDESKVDSLGEQLTFSARYVNPDFGYADFEMTNIPKEKLRLVLEKVYFTPAYWRASCGSDCFTINNRKTFKKKEFIVDTGRVKYKVRRVPEKIKQTMLDCYYKTDWQIDKLE